MISSLLDLEEQSIITGHTAASTVSTAKCIVLPDDNIQSKSIINNINTIVNKNQ